MDTHVANETASEIDDDAAGVSPAERELQMTTGFPDWAVPGRAMKMGKLPNGVEYLFVEGKGVAFKSERRTEFFAEHIATNPALSEAACEHLALVLNRLPEGPWDVKGWVKAVEVSMEEGNEGAFERIKITTDNGRFFFYLPGMPVETYLATDLDREVIMRGNSSIAIIVSHPALADAAFNYSLTAKRFGVEDIPVLVASEGPVLLKGNLQGRTLLQCDRYFLDQQMSVCEINKPY